MEKNLKKNKNGDNIYFLSAIQKKREREREREREGQFLNDLLQNTDIHFTDSVMDENI